MSNKLCYIFIYGFIYSLRTINFQNPDMVLVHYLETDGVSNSHKKTVLKKSQENGLKVHTYMYYTLYQYSLSGIMLNTQLYTL